MIEQDVNTIIRTLVEGEVVALPTDGVFGLFCLKNNSIAIEKIYELKQRNWNKKLCEYSLELPFWQPHMQLSGMTYIYNNVGYRSAHIHPKLYQIISKVGTLVGTSCNLSGTTPITNINHIPFDVIALNESCLTGIESTIFSLDTNEVIRSGYTETDKIQTSNNYHIKIDNDMLYEFGYECKDLAKYFWYFVNEYKSLNFNIQCSCYLCNLIKNYISIIKYNQK
jgi:tRNA A37 threonylcarbamoyladenosine synthetase subunit TsaC/SUA5/YrdC